MGDFYLTILSALAQVEVAQIKERIISGIANARRKNGNGAWGRKSNLTEEIKEEILLKRREGMGINSLRKNYKVSPKTLHSLFAGESVVA